MINDFFTRISLDMSKNYYFILTLVEESWCCLKTFPQQQKLLIFSFQSSTFLVSSRCRSLSTVIRVSCVAKDIFPIFGHVCRLSMMMMMKEG